MLTIQHLYFNFLAVSGFYYAKLVKSRTWLFLINILSSFFCFFQEFNRYDAAMVMYSFVNITFQIYALNEERSKRFKIYVKKFFQVESEFRLPMLTRILIAVFFSIVCFLVYDFMIKERYFLVAKIIHFWAFWKFF